MILIFLLFLPSLVCKETISSQNTKLHAPFIQDRTYGGQRHTQTHIPAYKTAHMAGRQSETHTNTQSLPIRPHIWQVAGQRHTQTHIPAYKTAHMAGRRSETHTNTQSLPTRPHIWQVAGQRHTQTHNPCLQDRTYGRSPVRDTHKHTIPAYKTAHMAGRRSETHTNTHPCQQDRTYGRSPVRDTHKHTIPAYKTAHTAGRRSETHTNTHPCRIRCVSTVIPQGVKETAAFFLLDRLDQNREYHA